VKFCSKCQENLDDSKFTKRSRPGGKEGLQPYCIECNRAYHNERYHSNKQKWSGRRSAQNAKTIYQNKLNVFKYFTTHPCIDCNENDVFRLQFDHLKDKDRNISEMVQGAFSWKRIENEIKKCEVRCANCHQVSTLKDRKWVKKIKMDLGI